MSDDRDEEYVFGWEPDALVISDECNACSAELLIGEVHDCPILGTKVWIEPA